ncbi:MAG TPA: hypothetical protein VNZ64_03755 [Candidatus Acidoferrum sp.]|jgi:hypothetical protein|nr:hypothetical protein [Candidatus Acidoferrum sp.]
MKEEMAGTVGASVHTVFGVIGRNRLGRLYQILVGAIGIVLLSMAATCPPVTLNTFTPPVQGVTTFIMMGGQVDTVNTCTPVTPPAPSPDTLTSGSADEIFVGHDHWRNTVDNCQESKVLVYRGLVKFDLAQLSTTKANLLSSALLEFDVIGTSSSTPPATGSPFCAAQLLDVGDPWTPGPPSNLNHFTQQFPRGNTAGGALREWTLPSSFPTAAGSTSIQATSQGHFQIDVVEWLKLWMAGQPNNGFMFTAVNEDWTLPVAVNNNSSCRTHMANFKLTVKTF